jgi:hypothetical protein
MFQAMKDLYQLVKADATLKHISVVDFTGSCYNDGEKLGWYLPPFLLPPLIIFHFSALLLLFSILILFSNDFTGRADYGNIHMYAFMGEVCLFTFSSFIPSFFSSF